MPVCVEFGSLKPATTPGPGLVDTQRRPPATHHLHADRRVRHTLAALDLATGKMIYLIRRGGTGLPQFVATRRWSSTGFPGQRLGYVSGRPAAPGWTRQVCRGPLRLRETVDVVNLLLGRNAAGYAGQELTVAPGTTLRYAPLRQRLPLLIGTWGRRTAELAATVANEVRVGG